MFEAMGQQSVLPDAISYNAMISSCEKSKQPKRALTVFEAIVQQGVVSNAIIYSTLISACEKG